MKRAHGRRIKGAAGAHPAPNGSHDGALHRAAEKGDLRRLSQLLANAQGGLNLLDAAQRTPLIAAVEAGQFESVRALLQAGADPNAADPDGNTALRLAAAAASPQIVQLLLSHGADPCLPGRMMLTPLDRARERRTPEGRIITAMMERYLQEQKKAASAPRAAARPAPRRRAGLRR